MWVTCGGGEVGRSSLYCGRGVAVEVLDSLQEVSALNCTTFDCSILHCTALHYR